MSDNIAGKRHPYRERDDILDMDKLQSRNPYLQFEKWFQEASESTNILEPNAMAVATATKSGVPSVRMVLMKHFHEATGFTFFTNYESRKAEELNENPICSLMFYWEPLRRSVRLEGSVEKVSRKESHEYFSSRPRESQIGALVSRQSQVIPSRAVIDEKYASILEKYGDDKFIPMPDYWGGYRVIPRVFEFWQGQTNRLHDRLVFRRPNDEESPSQSTGTHVVENGWIIERLYS